MNTISARRQWLIWRSDMLAGVAIAAFCIAAMWAAQNIVAVLRAMGWAP